MRYQNFIPILFLMILISGCVQEKQKTIKEANICGDGICGATEDCNNCAKDCECESNEYCDKLGICRKEICGDEICSSGEKELKNCCEDCGCTIDEVCNKVTHGCQSKPTIPETNVREIAENYLKENKIEGKIIKILDIYYRDKTVKQVDIDCKKEGEEYPCSITLFISNDGKIVDVLRTMQ